MKEYKVDLIIKSDDTIEFIEDSIFNFIYDNNFIGGSVISEVDPNLESLTLVKTNVYKLTAAIDERSTGVLGYYKSYSKANKASLTAGWYGSEGTVCMVSMYSDLDSNLYEVRKLGMCSDEQASSEEKLLDSIKSKLSEDELNYLKLME